MSFIIFIIRVDQSRKNLFGSPGWWNADTQGMLTLRKLVDNEDFFYNPNILEDFLLGVGEIVFFLIRSALSAAFPSKYPVIPGPCGSELHNPDDLQAAPLLCVQLLCNNFWLCNAIIIFSLKKIEVSSSCIVGFSGQADVDSQTMDVNVDPEIRNI